MTRITGSALRVQLMLAAGFLCCVCSPAFGDGVCPHVTVDENGHGSINFHISGNEYCFTATTLPLASVLAPDPGPGGLTSALTYDLSITNFGAGPPLVGGDVLLTNVACGGCVRDVIRFNPDGTVGNPYPVSLLFYSDSSPGRFYTNVVSIPEVNNSAFYTPTKGQPGFDLFVFPLASYNISYHFVGDTPEPGTLGLLGTGLLGLAGAIRHKLKG
jgi:hypothetical protein